MVTFRIFVSLKKSTTHVLRFLSYDHVTASGKSLRRKMRLQQRKQLKHYEKKVRHTGAVTIPLALVIVL